jgi:hypothetical protein
MIDYDEVLRFILDLIERNQLERACHLLRSVVIFHTFYQSLRKRDLPMVEVRQGQRTLSIPTVRFRDDLFNGKS